MWALSLDRDASVPTYMLGQFSFNLLQESEVQLASICCHCLNCDWKGEALFS